MDFTGYEIVSSVNTPHEQEFLIAVPEPRSWALLLTGLLLAGVCAFYRRKRAAQ
ncbi:MAG: PEP-CTERM sorting domain-containing protein [Bryobacteraceae bacterium]